MKSRNSIRLKRLLFELLFAALSMLILLPLALMILGSFKTSPEAARLTLDWPDNWLWDNYQVVYDRGKVGRAMMNSVLLTFSSVAIVTTVSGMAAFYLVRRNTLLNRVVQQLFMIGLIAPLSIITTLQVLQTIGLYGTYISVIFVFVSLHMPFSVFLFSGFVKTVPREVEEAGEIDGCGSLRLFFSVVFPLLMPVVTTCAIINFMGIWNDFTVPLFFLNQSDKWTMPLTVYNFFGMYASDWNLVFADLLLTTAPVAIVYIVGQRFIMNGMTAGAVKG